MNIRVLCVSSAFGFWRVYSRDGHRHTYTLLSKLPDLGLFARAQSQGLEVFEIHDLYIQLLVGFNGSEKVRTVCSFQRSHLVFWWHFRIYSSSVASKFDAGNDSFFFLVYTDIVSPNDGDTRLGLVLLYTVQVGVF